MGQSFPEGENVTRKIAAFDINPKDAHVRLYGPHLHLETQKKVGKNIDVSFETISIDPETIRPGDYETKNEPEPKRIFEQCEEGEELSTYRSIDNLKVKGRYANLYNSLLIEGSSDALRKFSEILHDASPAVIKLVVPGDLPATPYDGWLKTVDIYVCDGLVKIYKKDDRLIIKGEQEGLAAIADAMACLHNNSHIQFENTGDHLFLDEASLSLTVGIEKNV